MKLLVTVFKNKGDVQRKDNQQNQNQHLHRPWRQRFPHKKSTNRSTEPDGSITVIISIHQRC